MARRIRDLFGTVVVLCVLFGVLVSINPRVRERFGHFAGGVSDQEWSQSEGAIGNSLRSVVAVVSGFAADNTYLFSFVVVAGVLLFLMLRT